MHIDWPIISILGALFLSSTFLFVWVLARYQQKAHYLRVKILQQGQDIYMLEGKINSLLVNLTTATQQLETTNELLRQFSQRSKIHD